MGSSPCRILGVISVKRPNFGGAVTASLAEVLLWIAQDLEERHAYRYAGAITQGRVGSPSSKM